MLSGGSVGGFDVFDGGPAVGGGEAVERPAGSGWEGLSLRDWMLRW